MLKYLDRIPGQSPQDAAAVSPKSPLRGTIAATSCQEKESTHLPLIGSELYRVGCGLMNENLQPRRMYIGKSDRIIFKFRN
jgi:hypothetical protein